MATQKIVDINTLIKISTAAKKTGLKRTDCYYRVKISNVEVYKIDGVKFISSKDLKKIQATELYAKKNN